MGGKKRHAHMLLLLEMVPRIWVYLSPKESQQLMKQGHREPCLTIPTSKAWIQGTEKCSENDT